MNLTVWLVWAALAGCCAVALIAWLRETGEAFAPLPVFLATVSFYVLPRSAYLLWYGKAADSSGGLVADDQVRLVGVTLLVVLAGVCAFSAGHRSVGARRIGGAVGLRLPDADPARALLLSIALLGAGMGAFFIMINQMGGLGYVLSNQRAAPRLLEGKGILLNLSRLALVPVGLLFLDQARQRSRRPVWLLVGVTVLAFSILGRRSLIALSLAYPILLYHWVIRPFRLRTVMLASGVAAVAFTAFSYIRLLGPERIGQAYAFVTTRPEAAAHFLFSTGEFRVFDATTIVVRDVPEVTAPNFGATLARVPWWGIPRTLWTGKPVTLGEELVARYMPHIKAGHPPMLFGEAYAAGGPFAVVLALFGFGWLGRAVWEWGRRHRGVGNASLYILFCYFVYDATRVGDPSRTVWVFGIGAILFYVAFCLAAPTRGRATQPLA